MKRRGVAGAGMGGGAGKHLTAVREKSHVDFSCRKAFSLRAEGEIAVRPDINVAREIGLAAKRIVGATV